MGGGGESRWRSGTAAFFSLAHQGSVFFSGDEVWEWANQRFGRGWVGRGLAGAKQNAVGAWVFGKHARRPPWWQEEICRRRPPPADQVALCPGSRFPNSSANALKRNAGGHAGVSNKVILRGSHLQARSEECHG